MPHVIVGDEAFPLLPYMMRPYPGRGLSTADRVLSYRLSRARRMSENAFGILAARWRVYHRTMEQSPDTVDEIIKATIVLHNLLMKNNLVIQCSSHDNLEELVTTPTDTTSNGLLALENTRNSRASRRAFELRNLFRDYFMSKEGAVEWQQCMM